MLEKNYFLRLLRGKMKPVRLLIVDDHALARKGILMFLNTEPAVEIVGEATDGQEAIQMAQRLQPDFILLDLVMPGIDGIEATAQIKQILPNVKIIILTTFGTKNKFEAAMEAGADGYLLKDADGAVLLQAIEAIQQGDLPLHPDVTPHLIKKTYRSADEELTQREQEVLQLVAKGWHNKAIAQELNISRGTVKVHISSILSKLNVTSRTEAAMLAIKEGFTSTDVA